MPNGNSRVTIHMAASLDGFIARKNGSVDWLETSDRFESGEVLSPDSVAEFLRTIDCYVMGSGTYETALGFESKGLGWSYGDKPTFVLTHRELPKTRSTVEFYAGDLTGLLIVAAGLIPWIVLARINASVRPDFPWAALVTLGYVGILLAWLSGLGPPRNTVVLRKLDGRCRTVHSHWSFTRHPAFEQVTPEATENQG